jgi:hypothetical protein
MGSGTNLLKTKYYLKQIYLFLLCQHPDQAMNNALQIEFGIENSNLNEESITASHLP